MVLKELITMTCDGDHAGEVEAASTFHVVTINGAYAFDGCDECGNTLDTALAMVEAGGRKIANVRADRITQLPDQEAVKQVMRAKGGKAR